MCSVVSSVDINVKLSEYDLVSRLACMQTKDNSR